MSWVKINTFHWHIVDSQSFPLEVPGFMEISAQGAYSSTNVYSQSDVAGIVAYAAAVGHFSDQHGNIELMVGDSVESM